LLPKSPPCQCFPQLTEKKVVVVGERWGSSKGGHLAPSGAIDQVEVLHLCYPFQIKDFVGETARYIELFKPKLTIVNSTVGVGTTRLVAERTGAAVVNSPVRGKHARMLEELCMYTKFVGAIDPATGGHAAEHFESLGLKTKSSFIS
jgi:hypothetical protein